MRRLASETRMERWRSTSRCASSRTCQKSASVSWPIIWALKTGTCILENGFIVLAVRSLSWVWLCDSVDCSMLGFPVLHYLLEFAQNHVHRVNDAIQPSHPLSPPSPPSSPPSLPSCFPSIKVFPVRWLFASVGQSIGASALEPVLLMNIQGWFPLGLNVLISWQSKGLSRVFSNTTDWKHQFFGAQPSLWSSSHIHTWL